MTEVLDRLTRHEDGGEILRELTATPETVPPRVEARRSRAFLITALAALAGYLVLLLLVRQNRTVRADLEATLRFQRRNHPFLARLMGGVSWFGFRPQSLLLPASAVAGFWARGFHLDALFLLAAWAASLLSFTTKLIVRRPRPEHPAIQVVAAKIRDTSFPSGHTLHYVAFWGFFTYLVFTRARTLAARWLTVAVITPVIALVGPSRIWLGHHWLTDVLASYLLGTAYLSGLVALYRRVRGLTEFRNGRIF